MSTTTTERKPTESLTKNDVKAIADEIQAALEPVAEKHGLKVHVGGGTWAPTSFKPKIEFKTANADEQEFELYARFDGLEGTFGKTFTHEGQKFQIAGYSPRSPKRPVICENVGSGRRFKFTAKAVTDALGLASPSTTL